MRRSVRDIRAWGSGPRRLWLAAALMVALTVLGFVFNILASYRYIRVSAEALFDIVPNRVGFESWPPMGFAVTFIRSFLCFVEQVIAGINRRGIARKLP